MPELSTEAALIEMQSEIQKLMNDLETRINTVYDRIRKYLNYLNTLN